MLKTKNLFSRNDVPSPEDWEGIVRFFQKTQKTTIEEGLTAAQMVANKVGIKLDMAAAATAWSYGSINAGEQMNKIAVALARRQGRKISDYLTSVDLKKIKTRKMGVVLVGLGKMGGQVIQLLSERGISVVAFNRGAGGREKIRKMRLPGVQVRASLRTAIALAKKNRPGKTVVLTLIPAKAFSEAAITGRGAIVSFLGKGDILVDMGNTPFEWTLEHARLMREKYPDVHFVDCGTSGGIEGARNGSCLMVGCSSLKVKKWLTPIFTAMAKDFKFVYAGGSGAGHLVKGYHNGAEYGLMQTNAWLLGKFLTEGMTDKGLYQLVKKLEASKAQSYLLTCVKQWLEGLRAEGLMVIDDAGPVGGQTTYEMKILAQRAEESGTKTPYLKWAIQLREISSVLREPEAKENLEMIFDLGKDRLRHFLYQTAIVFGQRFIFGGHDRSVA